ncbi:hypothetical protein [uncultured Photobacterium sp.]|uniref:hypothetical protein n=1 Tax=uncultured Photobacterium sp. TaxID=173973 RepID=UPI002630F44A|nr:hypothetical protein [uncultured Photobacterium sp.]
MSDKHDTEKSYTLNFSGTCQHCGNATLIHVLEYNLQTCAFCHKPQTEKITTQTVSNQIASEEDEHINNAPMTEDTGLNKVSP